jgi:hypothetical protein
MHKKSKYLIRESSNIKLIGLIYDRLNMIRFMLIFTLLLPEAFAQWKQRSVKWEGENSNMMFEPSKDKLYQRGKFKYPESVESLEEYNFERELAENQKISNRMAAIKYEIINGNLEKAKVMLLEAKYRQDFSRPIQYRYLAMIHFIEGDFKRSLEMLQKKEMYKLENTSHICVLRTLNLLILNRHVEAISDWNRCLDATVSQSSTFHLWMNTLISLKTSNKKEDINLPLRNLSIENERGDFLRIYLKLALYLNQQYKIFPRIPYLGAQVYDDQEIRELLGLLFYRDGKLVNAYKFIEDLSSPNSENIKGNLYLAQKKYELAYGQFKLALQKKSNSQNALERIVPTAWLLKQWKDGLHYTNKLEVSPSDRYKKMAIKAAFQTQLELYDEAKDTLERVVVGSKNAQAPEVNQLYSFVGLMLNNKDIATDYADKSCKNYEGLNCWLQFQLAMWEDFTLTTKREDAIHNPKVNLLDEYRNSFTKDPIVEEEFISQKDIEELDNELILLIPQQK